jgi:hypothetical protein
VAVSEYASETQRMSRLTAELNEVRGKCHDLELRIMCAKKWLCEVTAAETAVTEGVDNGTNR